MLWVNSCGSMQLYTELAWEEGFSGGFIWDYIDQVLQVRILSEMTHTVLRQRFDALLPTITSVETVSRIRRRQNTTRSGCRYEPETG